jgi:hypothetical protein
MNYYLKIAGCSVILLFNLNTPVEADIFDRVFGYKNYEECILDKMKGVTSDSAAAQIARACRKLTEDNTESKCTTTNITSGEANNITGRASVSGFGTFTASLYNGNRDLRVKSIEFVIIGKVDGKDFNRHYKKDVNIKPLSNEEVLVSIGVNKIEEFSWYIYFAEACRE